MEHRIATAHLLMRKSVSTATWTAYTKVWQEWKDLLKEVGDGSPAELGVDLLLYFIGRNFEAGVSASYMSRKLAGLAFMFQLTGQQDVTKVFKVRRAMRGYRVGRAAADKRRPVSFAVLGVVVDQLGKVCVSEYERVLFRAVFVLAFFGAFRVGELVSRNKKGQGGLEVQDVWVQGDTLGVFLRRSKTDQLGKGARVDLRAVPRSPICPVWAVGEFCKLRPMGPGVFFKHEDGTALSRFQFQAVFKKCLVAAGLRAENYSSHSFRIGAATEAVRWGLDEKAVKSIGRWESARFRTYIRPHLL